MLTKPSPVCRKMLLFLLAHPFQGPNRLSGDVVTVDHNGGLRETNLGDFPEMRIHVDDNILNLFSVLKTMEIADHICLFAIGKNIYDLSIPGVCQDRLVLLPAGITFEFVDGQHLRKRLARVIDQVKITESCRCRDIMLSGYVGGRNGISKVLNDAGILAARHAMVAWEKAVLLIKPFPTAVACIPPLTKIEIDVLAKSRYILDLLLSVVVNPICLRSTTWAAMLTTGQLKLYMVCTFVFPDFFDDYIFQSKQFCSIIFVEHRGFPF